MNCSPFQGRGAEHCCRADRAHRSTTAEEDWAVFIDFNIVFHMHNALCWHGVSAKLSCAGSQQPLLQCRSPWRWEHTLLLSETQLLLSHGPATHAPDTTASALHPSVPLTWSLGFRRGWFGLFLNEPLLLWEGIFLESDGNARCSCTVVMVGEGRCGVDVRRKSLLKAEL